MRVKKKRKFQRGGGVFTNPSGTEIPSGWGVKTKKPSVGGVWIFSGTAHCLLFLLQENSVHLHTSH